METSPETQRDAIRPTFEAMFDRLKAAIVKQTKFPEGSAIRCRYEGLEAIIRENIIMQVIIEGSRLKFGH